MAGRFIDEIATGMGWKVEKDTAYGACQGYLFTVRSYAGITCTNVWLHTFGVINTTWLREYFGQNGGQYRMVQAPQSKTTGLEITQHFASAYEVREMIQSFASWLVLTDAKSGCKKCGKSGTDAADARALTVLNGALIYQCPECEAKTVICSETGSSSKANTASAPVYQDGPEGIGGWLILLIIGRFASIAMYLFPLLSIMGNQNALARIGMDYLSVISIALVITGLALEIAILVFIFKKKLLFRTLLLINIGYNLAIGYGIPLAFSSTLGVSFQASTNTIAFTIASALWIIYLFVSKRVRNTFERFEKKEKGSECSSTAGQES